MNQSLIPTTPGDKPSAPKIRSSLLETVERAFAFYDQDNSNSIDAAEVVSILRALGHDPTRAESRALLRKANVDRNGGVEVGWWYFTEEINDGYIWVKDTERLWCIEDGPGRSHKQFWSFMMRVGRARQGFSL